MTATYWIKLYHEILRDPKMARLPDRVWRRAIELFLLAGDTGDDGQLPEMPDVAWLLRVDEDVLAADMAVLAQCGILTQTDDGWLVTNFADRQAPVPDAERMARYRERQRRAQYYGTDPSRNGDDAVTNRNVDSDREDTDSEGEVERAEPDRRSRATATPLSLPWEQIVATAEAYSQYLGRALREGCWPLRLEGPVLTLAVNGVETQAVIECDMRALTRIIRETAGRQLELQFERRAVQPGGT